jgi:hypothetical protein
MLKKCNACKNEFGCTGTDNNRCWCEPFPKELLENYEDSCLCNACLTISISSNVDDIISNNDLDETIKIAQSFRDETRLFLDIDYTIEGNNYIFTKWYLLKRGFCCKSGCRNCPYPKD